MLKTKKGAVLLNILISSSFTYLLDDLFISFLVIIENCILEVLDSQAIFNSKKCIAFLEPETL